MQATITTLCVKNETNREIERAGLTFDAGEVREVEVPIGARVREIMAHVGLRVTKLGDNGKQVAAAVKKETAEIRAKRKELDRTEGALREARREEEQLAAEVSSVTRELVIAEKSDLAAKRQAARSGASVATVDNTAAAVQERGEDLRYKLWAKRLEVQELNRDHSAALELVEAADARELEKDIAPARDRVREAEEELQRTIYAANSAEARAVRAREGRRDAARKIAELETSGPPELL